VTDATEPMTDVQIEAYVRRQVMKALSRRNFVPTGDEYRVLRGIARQVRAQWMQDRERSVRRAVRRLKSATTEHRPDDAADRNDMG
jgi:hypothetical protein